MSQPEALTTCRRSRGAQGSDGGHAEAHHDPHGTADNAGQQQVGRQVVLVADDDADGDRGQEPDDEADRDHEAAGHGRLAPHQLAAGLGGGGIAQARHQRALDRHLQDAHGRYHKGRQHPELGEVAVVEDQRHDEAVEGAGEGRHGADAGERQRLRPVDPVG